MHHALVFALLLVAGCHVPAPVTVTVTRHPGGKEVLEITFPAGIAIQAGNVHLSPF